MDFYKPREHLNQTQPEAMLQSQPVAPELDAIASIQNLQGVTFVLDRDKVMIQNTETVGYALSSPPQEGNGEGLTFRLCVAHADRIHHAHGILTRFSDIYSVQSAKASENLEVLPSSYTISSEASSLYTYQHGGEINFDTRGLLEKVGLRRATKPLRLKFRDISAEGKSESVEVERRRIRGVSGMFEWISSGEILATESAPDVAERPPSFEIRTARRDYRLIHAIVLAWTIIVWHCAKLRRFLDRRFLEDPSDFAKKLTCKFAQPLLSCLS